MDQDQLKGKPALFEFKHEQRIFKLYGIVPDGWKTKIEDNFIVLSKDNYEINLFLLPIGAAESAPPEKCKDWYMHLINDFIPEEDNIHFQNLNLSMFTSKGLKGAYVYSAEIEDQESDEFMREDLIIIDQKAPLRVKGFGPNTEEDKNIIENFILSIRYDSY